MNGTLENSCWVFGRLNNHRGRLQNQVLHTLGLVTLVEGGRVSLSRELGISSWSEVGGSLVLSGSNQYPTIRFSESKHIGGMEIMIAPPFLNSFTHFLYPHRPISDGSANRVIYAVASHIRYARYREKLLPQLLAAGIPADRIWVTIAGAPEEKITSSDGITLSFVRENAYEYTVLSDIARRDLIYDWVFMLHDTCFAGPRCRALVESQPGTLEIDYMPVLGEALFNIGLYRRGFLEQIREYLRSLDGISKARAIDIELDREGHGLRNLTSLSSNFQFEFGQKLGVQTPYGPDQPRQAMYLPGADVHKFYHLDAPE